MRTVLFSQPLELPLLRFSPTKLQNLLDARGLKAYGAAKLMGVSTTWVQRLLAGEIRMPTDHYLFLLEQTFNVPYTELLEDTSRAKENEGGELSAEEINEWVKYLRKLPVDVRRQRLQALEFDAGRFEATSKHRLNEKRAEYSVGGEQEEEEEAKEQ